MTAPETPLLPVLFRAQAVPNAKMAAQNLATKATIQTNYVAVPNGLPH
jgi:hypothetical protein